MASMRTSSRSQARSACTAVISAASTPAWYAPSAAPPDSDTHTRTWWSSADMGTSRPTTRSRPSVLSSCPRPRHITFGASGHCASGPTTRCGRPLGPTALCDRRMAGRRIPCPQTRRVLCIPGKFLWICAGPLWTSLCTTGASLWIWLVSRIVDKCRGKQLVVCVSFLLHPHSATKTRTSRNNEQCGAHRCVRLPARRVAEACQHSAATCNSVKGTPLALESDTVKLRRRRPPTRTPVIIVTRNCISPRCDNATQSFYCDDCWRRSKKTA